jgi:hypothetical protein
LTTLLYRMWRSPRLLRVLFAVSLPAMVTIVFAPLWAILVCLIATIAAAMFVYAEILSPKFVHQRASGKRTSRGGSSRAKTNSADDEPNPSSKPREQYRENTYEQNSSVHQKSQLPQTDAQRSVMEQLVDFSPSRLGAHTTENKDLSRYAWQTLTAANNAQLDIRSVIQVSTHASLELANCIRELESNSDTQNHLSKALLESTSARNTQDSSLSDLASKASAILKRQNTQLLNTAEQATSLIKKQQAALAISNKADELLQAADKAARELAINSMGSQSPIEHCTALPNSQASIVDPWAFVQNHRKTLKELRSDLDDIRSALSQVTIDLQSNVNSLQHVAQSESSEVTKVTESIQLKLEETRNTVNALNELSKDTESHIHSAVVAMQYHDITTQKLATIDNLHLESIILKTRSLINIGTDKQASPEPSAPPAKASPSPIIETSNDVDLFVT